ncbi:PadR family transcriptional regulator [Pseudonocardia asaccharolytica]|uniref:PadR family transcriptional regulator n=1 Tax=Pseudonocardia asaccharolytica TaxID=54010 RepID=UPI001FE026FA|nr:PadR family transcriptional regulator [Pseudonocardia asaccharolytica]
MSAARLSATSYVVLGMIALRGPSTPYDLKRMVGDSVGYFWHFPHAQLYSEPARLATLGLLGVTTEDIGRRRKTYSLTDAGRATLEVWLAAPTHDHFQIRDIAELKLFFGCAGDPANIAALAHEQIKRHQDRIAVYEGMQERLGGDPDGPGARPRMLTLELGLEIEYAALRFWTALADDDLGRLRHARRAGQNGEPRDGTFSAT